MTSRQTSKFSTVWRLRRRGRPVTRTPARTTSRRTCSRRAVLLVVFGVAALRILAEQDKPEQYKVGQKVTPAQALPGDLIFYGPEGTQSVALFIGNGQMVETTDEGVAVSSVRTNDMTPYLVRIIA